MSLKKSGQTKKFLLIGLLVLFLAVLVYQFTGGTKTPRTSSPANSNAAPGRDASAPISTADQTARAASKHQRQNAELTQLLGDITPLNVTLLGLPGPVPEGKRGNIFNYYVPPPPPPPKPDPPPPIGLKFVQPQTAVAGTPKSFTLTVTGEGFPPDAQIIFGG